MEFVGEYTMKCTIHPEREASGICVRCGKLYCSECLVEINGRMYCRDDLNKLLEEAQKRKQSSQAQPTIVINNDNNNINTNQNYNNVNNYVYKSKTVALILCLAGLFCALGGLHRFYVGKIGTGIIWFFTGGFFMIVTIIDLIAIISGGFRDCSGHPLI